MKLKIRPLREEEWKYACRQSRSLILQTGSIGYLRADFGREGNVFYSTWSDQQSELKTERFMEEFSNVINTLRMDERYGGMLKTRSRMVIYCNEHPSNNLFGSYSCEHGFRVDTDEYIYMLRLNPNRGDYNIYCYCYQKNMFNYHINRARNGVRFISLGYQKQFILPDGEQIRIFKPDGEQTDHIVRYIDEFHFEIQDEKGAHVFHIRAFAEKMKEEGNIVIPIRVSSPKRYIDVGETNEKMFVLERVAVFAMNWFYKRVKMRV